MNNVNQLSLEEMNTQLYVTSFKFVHDTTMSFIKFYDNQCKMLTNDIKELEEKEPFKIFKDSHKLWENELSRLKKEYKKAFDNLMGEYQELDSIVKLAKN